MRTRIGGIWIAEARAEAQEIANRTGHMVILQVEAEYPFKHISHNPCRLWWHDQPFWEFFPTR